jgi:hypothetical protein
MDGKVILSLIISPFEVSAAREDRGIKSVSKQTSYDVMPTAKSINRQCNSSIKTQAYNKYLLRVKFISGYTITCSREIVSFPDTRNLL